MDKLGCKVDMMCDKTRLLLKWIRCVASRSTICRMHEGMTMLSVRYMYLVSKNYKRVIVMQLFSHIHL